MEIEKGEKARLMQLRETALETRRYLERRFGSSKTIRDDMISPERGAENFARTLSVVVSETHDPDAVVAVAQTLKSIIDLPIAEAVSWYMRAFVRRATPEQVVDYADLIHRICALAPDKLELEDIKNNGLVVVELERLRRMSDALGQEQRPT